MQQFVFVLADAPYHGVTLPETLDFILTTAAFDQAVTLLFVDDGVFQLKAKQQAADSGMKDSLAMFDALSLYGVTDLLVETESLWERGLAVSDLALSVKEISRTAVAEFMVGFDHVC